MAFLTTRTLVCTKLSGLLLGSGFWGHPLWGSPASILKRTACEGAAHNGGKFLCCSFGGSDGPSSRSPRPPTHDSHSQDPPRLLVLFAEATAGCHSFLQGNSFTFLVVLFLNGEILVLKLAKFALSFQCMQVNDGAADWSRPRARGLSLPLESTQQQKVKCLVRSHTHTHTHTLRLSPPPPLKSPSFSGSVSFSGVDAATRGQACSRDGHTSENSPVKSVTP